RTELGGERAGEADHAGLAGDVMDEVVKQQDHRIGGQVDDAAPALLPHSAGERLGHQKHRIEIDREHAPPVLEGDLVEALHRVDAGIVDQDVAAPAVLVHFILELGDACRIADVAMHGDRAATDGPYRL